MFDKKFTYAYNFDNGDCWRHFNSVYPPEPHNIQAIAEDALEYHAVRHTDYDFSDAKIIVAIRCHSYAFYGNVENCPIFTATPITRKKRGTECQS